MNISEFKYFPVSLYLIRKYRLPNAFKYILGSLYQWLMPYLLFLWILSLKLLSKFEIELDMFESQVWTHKWTNTHTNICNICTHKYMFKTFIRRGKNKSSGDRRIWECKFKVQLETGWQVWSEFNVGRHLRPVSVLKIHASFACRTASCF